MQKSFYHLQNIGSLRVLQQQSLCHMGSGLFQISTRQHSSPIVFPEKRGKIKSARQNELNIANEDPDKVRTRDHRIDVGNEHSDLLGYEVFSGKLALDKRSKSTYVVSGTANPDSIDAKLTSKALVWGSNILCLKDVVSVSYNSGLQHFTVHSYPIRKRLSGLSGILKPHRSRKDIHFLASSSEEAIQWVSSFADQQCFVNCLPHPVIKKQASDLVTSDLLFDQLHIKCRSPKVLVILNPRSGHGCSSKVFHGKVEPIFELAGFMMEVVKTTSAGHARTLASTVNFSTCPDGIVCVGGDGIVNEVLNGLLSRDNQKEALSIPIGIVPAGSDNSLVRTVLGVRDPISAAIAIVKVSMIFCR